MAAENLKWVLPAGIPFAELKARDLEECVYWLMDAMGARDLEWHTGGIGGGAADATSKRPFTCLRPTARWTRNVGGSSAKAGRAPSSPTRLNPRSTVSR